MDDVIRENIPEFWATYQQYRPFIDSFARHIAPLRAAFLHWESIFFRFVYPSIYPFYRLASYAVRHVLMTVLNSASSSLSSSSSSSSSSNQNYEFLISILSLFIILWLSLRALDFVRRQIMWWISLVTTLVTWSFFVFAGLWIYTRGIQQTADDLAWVLGLVLGWAQQAQQAGDRLANEKEWDAERYRRMAGSGGGGGRYGSRQHQRPMARGM